MYNRFKESKLLFWSVELLIIATLILVGTKINFIFKPIGTMFTTLFAPILISGFLFYCFKPVVSFLEKRGTITSRAKVVSISKIPLTIPNSSESSTPSLEII